MWCCLWRKDNVVEELESRVLVALEWGEVYYEVVLDSEDGVAGQVLVVGWEDLGGDWDVFVVGDLNGKLVCWTCGGGNRENSP